MRTKIFELIDPGNNATRLTRAYNIFMIATIICSLIPLAFRTPGTALILIERITVVIFILDYILRYITANIRLKRGRLSYLLHPITPMAIIDLLCILPSFSILGSGFRILKVVRLFRAFRALKVFRYSRSIKIIINVIKKQGAALITVFGLAGGYMLVSALIMFNVEPDIFDTFFDAVYWAAISLTTIGYGDITPATAIGRLITILSAFAGIAIIALPSGIITAGLMDEIRKKNGE